MKNITMKKNEQYYIDVLGKKIYLTKKFVVAAGTMGSPEYKQYMELKREHSDCEFLQREIHQKENKKTYHELTYKVMEKIIEDVYKDDDKTKSVKISEFEAIKAFYDDNTKTKYGHVKSWFVRQADYKKAYFDKYDNDNAAA